MKTFSQFLEEAKAAKPDSMKTISRNWERRPGYKGLNLYATRSNLGGSGTHDEIHDLFVPKSLRGKGVGERILRGLTRHADNAGATMSLSQSPEPGFKKKLSDFYKRHGFVPNKGRNKSFVTRNTHIRYPKSDSK